MRNALLAGFLVLALGLAGVLFWQGAGTSFVAPEATTPRARGIGDTPPEVVSEAGQGQSAEAPALPPLDPAELADRRDLGSGESPELLAALPTRIDYPLQEKYQGEVWSDVPYELIAAHDGQPDQEGEGARRLFVAVVEPGLSDARLARLVRDLRARHREADVLRIRVFDSRGAATRPSWTDGGVARDAHLIGDLYRDTEREWLLLRGEEVLP